MRKNIRLYLTVLTSVIALQLKAQTGNTKSGTSAGSLITTGDYNVATGYCAGKALTTGSNNAFLGAFAGLSNTSGLQNTFVGMGSGSCNTTGMQNSYVGTHSGYMNTTNSNNSMFGYYAGYNNQAQGNSFFGSEAGLLNTTGGYNTFLGYKCFPKNTTGEYNTAIGYYAGIYNTTGNYNTSLGYYSGRFDDSNHYNIGIGYYSGYNMAGNYNLCIGYNTGNISTNVSSSYTTLIGYSANANGDVTRSTAIGYDALVTKDNCIVLGGNASPSYIGINLPSPDYTLQLNDAAAAKPGSSTWTIASDQRLKKEITDFNDGLNMIEKIRPVWFSYNGEAGMPTNKKFVGIIAQEMQEIAPYTVGSFDYEDSLGNKTTYLDYDANALFYMLVNSIKEQQSMIKNQQASIEKMKNQILQLLNDKNSGNTTGLESNLDYCNASLEQNYPNPFSENTIIKYTIQGSAKEALMVITSLQGKEMVRYVIETSGEGQISIPSHTIAAGSYFYQLIVDGNLMDVKQLEIVK